MTSARMPRVVTVLAALVGPLAAAPAFCDMVKLTNGLVYDPVTVTDVAAGTIQFRTPGGLPIKSLKEVAAVRLDGEKSFNTAEDLLQKGQYDPALEAYRDALASTTVAWRKTLVRHRQLVAAEAAGRIDEALGLWLALADEARGDAGVLELRPTKLAAKGSAANDRAIALLKARADKVKPEAYRAAVLQALAELYERQGRLAEAQAILAKLAGRTTQPGEPTENGQARVGEGPSAGTTNAQLRLAAVLLKRGEHEKVVSTLQPNLDRFVAEDLPAALYLLGQAQLELAKRQQDPKAARELSLEAGLNLMRVAVFFPAGEEAPQALLLAGQANENLGSASAARAAYSAVISRFAESRAAKAAQAALERIRNK